MRTLLRVLLVVVLGAAAAYPNDTFVALGAGGLVPVKANQIVMQSEELLISTHQISIQYVFANPTDKDIVATVAFPLPELAGGDVENEPLSLPSEADLNFVQFAVEDEGKAVPVRVEYRAYAQGREITSRLRAAGLAPNVLLEPLNASLLKVPESNRRDLEKAELIVPSEFNPPLHSVGSHGWWATWSMRVQYYWTQRFPAHSTMKLTQRYKPIVGGSYIVGSDDGRNSVRPYCGGPDVPFQIAETKKRHHSETTDGIALLERTIDYILTTANNWNGPIRDFHLTVSLDSPEDILLTCTPGLHRTAPMRYELTRQNFHPSSELKLLILQVQK